MVTYGEGVKLEPSELKGMSKYDTFPFEKCR